MILYKADQIKIVQIQTQIKSLREWGKKSSLWPSNFKTHYVCFAWQSNESFQCFDFSENRKAGIWIRFINMEKCRIAESTDRAPVCHSPWNQNSQSYSMTLTPSPLWDNKCPLTRKRWHNLSQELRLVHYSQVTKQLLVGYSTSTQTVIWLVYILFVIPAMNVSTNRYCVHSLIYLRGLKDSSD